MSTATRRALYGQLASSGSLTPPLLGQPAPGYGRAIYHEEAPQGALYPFVIFSKNSGTPTEAFHDPSALETDVWLVKVIDRNSTADAAEAVMDIIKPLLNDQTISISGSACLYLRRQSDVEYAELVEGVEYRHVGSLFRLTYD